MNSGIRLTPGPHREDSEHLLQVDLPAHLGDSNQHTMPRASLRRYIEMKIHKQVHQFLDGGMGVIRVVGRHDRSFGAVGEIEKRDKEANWQRPTALLAKEEGVLYLCVFPGHDYVLHYYLLVTCWKRFFHPNAPCSGVGVELRLPPEQLCRDTLQAAVPIDSCRDADVVILGIVDRLRPYFQEHDGATGFDHWQEGGDCMKYCSGEISSRAVVLVCVYFSLWSDIGGRLVELLGQEGKRKTVIYCGKVGSLTKGHVPNATLVTGNRSVVLSGENQPRVLSWTNEVADRLMEVPRDEDSLMEVAGRLMEARDGILVDRDCLHYNSPSILLEHKQWLDKQSLGAHIVDPEIGSFALKAEASSLDFAYLHIVSNSLVETFEADLSNERAEGVAEKRTGLFKKMVGLLVDSLKSPASFESPPIRSRTTTGTTTPATRGPRGYTGGPAEC